MLEETVNTEQTKEQPAEIYITWRSPSRPFKKREAAYFKRAGLLLLILSLLFIFFKQFLLVAVLLALAFVGYVLVTVAPEEVEHRISSQGITSGGKSYLWEELKLFYFTRRLGNEILNVETTKFPGILIILLASQNKEKIKSVLMKRISFREVAPISYIDRLTEGLTRFLSLE